MIHIKKRFETLFQIIVPVLLIAYSSNAHAVRWVGEMGIHVGGDKVANATYTNGDSASLRAGSLISFGIGPQFDLSQSSIIRSTIGYKADSVTAENGSIEFSRVPIDVMYFYQTEQWMFGAGITYHLNSKLSGDGVASDINAKFDDALGYLAEIDFRLGEFFYIGGKFTFIDYVPKDNTFPTSDGNSIGVVMGFVFGDK